MIKPIEITIRVYTALITQSGTAAPIATVLHNTLEGNIVWTRSSAGVYIGTLAGAFTENKTVVFMSDLSPTRQLKGKIDTAPNTVTIHQTTNIAAYTPVDDLEGTIEIRVYK